MTFAHSILLAGLGGMVLPLVVHLLSRARPQTVSWGAMMFLHGNESGQERRGKARGWLLMLLRMSIIGVLAIALARPVLQNQSVEAAPADRQRMCVAVLFDNAAGMAFDEGTAGLRIEMARSVSLSLLNQLQRDDEVRIIPLAPTETPPPADANGDLQSAVLQVADLHPSGGAADIAAGLATATRYLKNSSAARKVIVLVADREANGWRNVSDFNATNWRERTLDLHESLRFIYLPVGSENSTNVALERLVVPSNPIVRGMDVPVEAIVHNFGRAPLHGLPIELRSIGQRYDEKHTIDVPAGAVATSVLNIRFAALGPHVLVARLAQSPTSAGDLTFDDQCEAIANVVPPLNVRIAGESSATQPTTAPAIDVIGLALNPTQLVSGSPVNAFASVTNGPIDFPENCNVVVIRSATTIPTAAVAKLQQYVFDGGGLLVVPDEAGGVSESLADLLPATLNPPQAVHGGNAVRPTPIFRKVLTIPIDDRTLLEGMTVDRLCPARRHAADAQSLLQTPDGRPVLITRPFGRGRVSMLTTPLPPWSGQAWNTLADRPGFVTLMQAIVGNLASGSVPRLNLQPGEPIEYRGGAVAWQHASVVGPDDDRQDAEILAGPDRTTVRYTGTNRPGRYQLQLRGEKQNVTIPFIVSATREASDLTPIVPAKLNRLEQLLDLHRMDANDSERIIAAFDRPHQVSLWRAGILLVVALAVVDVIFASLLARRNGAAG